VKVPFRSLPGLREAVPRPLLRIFVEGLEETGLLCLADTGTLHNRFALWIAREAGIDLGDAEPVSLGIGGRATIARTVTVGLRLAETSWEAPVSFCDPWPWDFNLLGQEGFFRWFQVAFDAADRSLEVGPNR